jgi:hypothetical protein
MPFPYYSRILSEFNKQNDTQSEAGEFPVISIRVAKDNSGDVGSKRA